MNSFIRISELFLLCRILGLSWSVKFFFRQFFDSVLAVFRGHFAYDRSLSAKEYNWGFSFLEGIVK